MSPFWQALTAWERAPGALAAFDRHFAAPLAGTPAELWGRLYRGLAEWLIGRLELPCGPGGALREWGPLFRFGAEADPFYVTEGQVAAMLARCPPLTPEPRERLSGVLQRYFGLVRGGFLKGFPSPLVSQADCRRWSELFAGFPEPETAWDCLAILHGAGLTPLGGAEGWRAWLRWEKGAFASEATPAALWDWQAGCAEAAGTEPGGHSAHRLDFLAAAFGGGFAGLGVDGPCGEVPRCGDCGLKASCAWAGRPAKEAATGAEALGRLGTRRAGGLDTAQLMQGLFGLNERDGKALAAKLENAPLRTLAAMSRAELEEWAQGTGLPEAGLQALFELCRRFADERLAPGLPLQSAHAVFRHFRTRLRDTKQEHFLAVLLDARRCYLGEVLVTLGTLDQSPVHPREVFSPAIRERASSVLIVHNHPSGDPTPSADDVAVTRRLAAVGREVGIPLIDHVIVGEERYVSFLEQDLL